MGIQQQKRYDKEPKDREAEGRTEMKRREQRNIERNRAFDFICTMKKGWKKKKQGRKQ
jgi:hypothetical protein